jgi:hypothetical protein
LPRSGFRRRRYTALLPNNAKTTAKINPTTNSIQAIFVATPAIPVKPKTAATSATIKKVTAQPIILIAS